MGFGNFPMINILSQRLVGNPRNWENSQHLRTLDLVVVVAVLRKCGMERRLFTCSATRVPDPESRSVRTVPYRVLLLATVPVDLLTKNADEELYKANKTVARTSPISFRPLLPSFFQLRLTQRRLRGERYSSCSRPFIAAC